MCVERLLHFALNILLHFALMLLHFALVLHFAVILITFCGDYYIFHCFGEKGVIFPSFVFRRYRPGKCVL